MYPTAGPPPVRPSAWWYAATVGVALLGLAVAIALLVDGFRGVRRTGQEVTRIGLDSSGTVTFEHPDSFTLYYVGPRVATTEADVRAVAAQIDPILRPAGGGGAVPMRPYEGTQSIVNRPQEGYQLVPLRTFTITRAGDYLLEAGSVEGVTSERAELVVSKSLIAPLARGALWALVAAGLGGLISLVATVALAVTRGRNKRQQRPPWPGRPPPGPWPPAGQWQPAGAWPSPPGWPGPPPGPVPPPPPGYGPPGGPR